MQNLIKNFVVGATMDGVADANPGAAAGGGGD